MTIPAELHGQKYISLTTYRKSGVPVRTPVWFAEQDDKLYVMSEREAGKIKRVRNNPKVKLAPCTFRGRVTGPEFTGTARVLPSGEEFEIARQAVRQKYWLARLSFRSRRNQYLEIQIQGIQVQG
ncbi:MAG TPA: PPOX class F420-dependent oxidoreductase [Terriglobales bacterium]|nr:PPOX class F420-dependent oxidoreductase [Terriglobales bacterium]